MTNLCNIQISYFYYINLTPLSSVTAPSLDPEMHFVMIPFYHLSGLKPDGYLKYLIR